MINDSFKIFRALEARGLLEPSMHQSFAKLAKRPCLMVRLAKDGQVDSLRFINATDTHSLTNLTSNQNGRLWPAITISGLDESRGLPAKAKGAGSVAETWAAWLPFASVCEDVTTRVERLRTTTAGLKIAGSGAAADLQSRLALFLANPKADSALIELATSGQATPESLAWLGDYLTKGVIITFDLAEGGLHTISARRALSDTLFANYGDQGFTVAGEPLANPGEKKKAAKGEVVDVFTRRPGTRCESYPKVAVPCVGEIYLFSRNSRTVEGYGIKDWPQVTVASALMVTDAVRQLFAPENENRLWKNLGASQLLVVIPEWKGVTDGSILMWDAPARDEADASLSADRDAAESALAALDAGDAPQEGKLRLLLLRPIDKGNKRWSGTHEERYSDFVAAARHWHRDIAGPNIGLRVWSKPAGSKKAVPVMAHLRDRRIGVADAVKLLNTRWPEISDNRTSQVPVTNIEVMLDAYMHGTKQTIGAVALDNTFNLLFGVAKAAHVGAVPGARGYIALQTYRAFQLLFPEYMDTSTKAYELGRLLNRIDGLHALKQRDSDFTGELAGSKYAKLATQAPLQAIDFLAGEITHLLAWAKKPSCPERALALWFVGEINDALSKCRDIAPQLTPEGRMQFLLGFTEMPAKREAADKAAAQITVTLKRSEIPAGLEGADLVKFVLEVAAKNQPAA